MPRRRRNTEASVSLFPFLSILACVIGTLTLMITALALGQMDTDAVQGALAVESAQEQTREARLDLVQLRIAVAKAETQATDLSRELDRARQQLAELENEQRQVIAKRKTLDAAPNEAPNPDNEPHNERDRQQLLSELQEELSQRQDKIKEKQAELAARGAPPDEAEVKILPGGSGVGLVPTFVECTPGSIVIHDGPKSTRVRTAELATNPAFVSLVKRVAAQPKRTIVFLLRDNGLGTYHAASALARENYARNGKLPVVGQGRLDLSVFKR